MKKLITVVAVLLIIAFVVGCAQPSAPATPKPSPSPSASPSPSPSPSATPSPSPSPTAKATTPAAPAKAYNLTFNYVMPKEDPTGAAQLRFVEDVKKRSNGQLNINAQLHIVKQTEAPGAVSSGTVDMGTDATATYQAIVPELGLFMIPFVITSDQAFFNVVKSLPELDALFAAKNLVNLSWVSYGPRSIETKSTPVKTLEDMRGQKFRIMPDPLLKKAWEAWGAQVLAVSSTEIPTALDTGTINGIDYYWVAAWSYGYKDLLKYITMSNHSVTPVLIVMNKKVYDGLPDNLKQVLKDAARAYEADQAASRAKYEADMKKVMENYGWVFYDLPETERAKFKAAVAPVIADAKTKFGSFADKFFAAADKVTTK